MASGLKRRVALLESAKAEADIKSMTDEELEARIRTLSAGSPGFYETVLARIGRHPSTIPVVADDLEYEG